MKVQLIDVPFDSGHWGVRMGRGPAAILAGGLPGRLSRDGHEVEHSRVLVPDRFPTEIATGFAVSGEVSRLVRAAVWQSRFPLVLLGSCLLGAGVVAGLGRKRVGAVWLDAHADFNTPETTPSGLLDGMALAVLTGRCWSNLTATIPGFTPVDPRDVLLIGARAFDPLELPLVETTGIHLLPPRLDLDQLDRELSFLGERVDAVYLHLDLDVLDSSVCSANGFSTTGGLSLSDVFTVLAAVHARVPLRASALSAYDPECDRDGTGLAAALSIIPAMIPTPG